jgi:hypothetical protein
MMLRPSPDVIYEVIDGRAMLVSPDGAELISLNAVGTMVWELLNAAGDAGRLAAELHPRFEGVTLDELQRDIADFLEELRKQGLVRETDA